jgi:hypothetical protein
MGKVVVDAFQPAAPAAHRPRVTIDKVVLSREQWTFQVTDSAWAFAIDEQERYRLARRWRQDHQLPERVFYRVPAELKPVAADFRSIVLVNLLARHIRQTRAAGHAEFTVTEMLPDLDQLWLLDRQGRRYSSELRIVAYDGITDEHPPRVSAAHGWESHVDERNMAAGLARVYDRTTPRPAAAELPGDARGASADPQRGVRRGCAGGAV